MAKYVITSVERYEVETNDPEETLTQFQIDPEQRDYEYLDGTVTIELSEEQE
jgi:hypothetical protein